jgi:signal transduction histidine kinase
MGGSGTTPERRRLMGRVAAVLFLCSGAIVLLTIPFLPTDASGAGSIAVCGGALAIGVFAWLAPWDRWPWWSTLLLVPPAFVLIAFGNVYGGSDLLSYGVFFVVAFVWIGLAHRPWTSLAMLPLAVVAFVVPLFWLPVQVPNALVSGVMTLAACVMVGETLAWGAHRLARTEAALLEHRETERRLRELDQMKTTFMSTVSHELRTPITIVRGHLEILRDDPAPTNVTETTDLVLDELDGMTRLIDDISVLVRDGDASFLRPEALDAADVVDDVALRVKPLLNGRLRVDHGPAAAAVIVADPVRLRQALLNLLNNAVSHTPEATTVTLRVVPVRRAWRFEVVDTGHGLERGDEARAFAHFWRGDRSNGSGLGLGVVRSIAQAHGGAAGVDNRPGEGATFWLTIPR